MPEVYRSTTVRTVSLKTFVVVAAPGASERGDNRIDAGE